MKELYPSTSKYAWRGYGNGFAERPAPPEPTDAPPGTPEKVEVMLRRVRDGFAPHHPRDVKERKGA